MFSQDSLSYDPLPLPDRAAYTDAQMQEKATEFLAHMQRRHTVRDFTDQPVPRQVIEDCIRAAGTAPSGANHQPWFFAAVSNPELKARIRAEAEEEERKFYAGGAGDEWIKALEPIGTNEDKPHLTIAPWLIVVFAQRWGEFADGTRYKNYYVPESVNIATGVLLTALHTAGLVSLTHTPNPMKFLNGALGRPASEKPTMIIAVGHPAENAMVPSVAKFKKPLEEICQVFE
ncbi:MULTISPECIES: nitroreductase family protein [Rhodobacterales]|jgi:nitroreductase|uniref:nitroreductase family protein n=1 Tax=Rhodobacterales TaxID=204455 RepID=UPI00237F3EF2|nr:nitroreductase family protein [Phaeobacter gallaeciensis]MDE4142455.1 nitroreductase family protein [Phaeobacter gallaeciensis]MDE4150909.1 nitroreductase family protein [Phaeobacter gallaeciensis]MDE4155129.1 nitroreductase family protein [Phaeobacter gallaeciensis]MDE4191137.1 nitroreductase family protein [Phaeobacter gallaeciensis]MDE4199603.1 nitroreductase family protein [Phaeobacter gallaeciensis]